MRRNLVPVFVGLIVIVLLGGLIGWWVTRSSPAPTIPTEPATNTAPQTETSSIPNVEAKTVPAEPPAEPANTEEPSSLATEPVTDANWELKLDEVLGNEKIEEEVKAEKIAEMIPKVSAPAQKELAGHLVNLTSDEGYAKAANILKDDRMPAEVSEVLLDDLFNRDQSLMLPLMLEIAKNEKHPLKDEAKSRLEMVLQEDFGTNWAQWNKAIEKTLKGEQ